MITPPISDLGFSTDKVQIIQNAVYIPEKDTYLISSHVHDFRSITLDDGKEYYVDGGRDYIRAGGHLTELYSTNRVVKFHLYSNDSFTEKVAKMLLWGTRGVNGDQPLKFRPLSSYTSDHLKAILANCPSASPYHRLVAHHNLFIRGDL